MSNQSKVPPGAGLCAHCRHVRTVTSARGSVFVLCNLAKTDPDFPRYPPLPVLRCGGFKLASPPGSPAQSGEDRRA